MTSQRDFPKGSVLSIVWVGLPLLLGVSIVTAQPAASPAVVLTAPPQPTVVRLDLAQALHQALERHPKVAANRASLAAAQDGLAALENLRLLALLDHEIAVRREQAAAGVAAATADLHRIEHEVVYAATRAYFSVVFAREQEKVAHRVVERLQGTHSAAAAALKALVREVTTTDVDRTMVYIRLAQIKQVQARQGTKRALAALREAVGLGPGCTIAVAAAQLPQPSAQPRQDEIVTLALAGRDDIHISNLFADITSMEVRAQGTRLSKRMDTFAAGADIHSHQVPQTVRESEEFRPGSIPPEMPDTLVGCRSDRIKHAESLNARACAAALVTRNLIALEAENAFLLWEQAAEQITLAREAAQTGEKLADSLDKQHAGFRGGRVRVEEVVNAHVLAAQARSQYNEILFRQIIGLAELERVTAGGFHARLSDAAP
jgi:outer membrane protein TolC